MNNQNNQGNQNKWYHQSGKNGDIVVSTRVRLARNIADFPFPHKLTADGCKEIDKKVRDALIGGNSALAKDFDYIQMENLSQAQSGSLVERHLISPEFAANRIGRALLLKKDESISIMLCEEDHLRIQVMSAGLALKETYAIADKIDTLLDNELHFAFDDRLGYLTGCPTNLGTGMRASLMLHLPMLEAMGGIERLAGAISKIGLTLRGSFGEGSKPKGALYQLSNQITLGIDESSALENLSAIAEQMISKEREARVAADRTRLEDTVFRSLGALKFVRVLTSGELDTHISNLRLGISMGILSDLPLEKINTIATDFQPAGLVLSYPDAENPAERDMIRAKLVREILS